MRIRHRLILTAAIALASAMSVAVAMFPATQQQDPIRCWSS